MTGGGVEILHGHSLIHPTLSQQCSDALDLHGRQGGSYGKRFHRSIEVLEPGALLVESSSSFGPRS